MQKCIIGDYRIIIEYKRIIRDYYEQLYGNKMDNLKEMDKCLEKLELELRKVQD